MTEFKGTKGPWAIEIGYYESKINTSTHRIAEAKHYDSQIDETLIEPSPEEGRANAKLITAAPDLLEALNIAYGLLNSASLLTHKQINEANEIIEAAINKATE